MGVWGTGFGSYQPPWGQLGLLTGLGVCGSSRLLEASSLLNHFCTSPCREGPSLSPGAWLYPPTQQMPPLNPHIPALGP